MQRHLWLWTLAALTACATPKRSSSDKSIPRFPIRKSLEVAYPELKKCLRVQAIRHESLVFDFGFFESLGRMRVVYIKINHNGYRPMGRCMENQLKRLRLASQDQATVHRYRFEYQKDSRRFVIRKQMPKKSPHEKIHSMHLKT